MKQKITFTDGPMAGCSLDWILPEEPSLFVMATDEAVAFRYECWAVDIIHDENNKTIGKGYKFALARDEEEFDADMALIKDGE